MHFISSNNLINFPRPLINIGPIKEPDEESKLLDDKKTPTDVIIDEENIHSNGIEMIASLNKAFVMNTKITADPVFDNDGTVHYTNPTPGTTDNGNKIDLDKLFRGKDSLSLDEVLNFISDESLHNDEGIKKLVNYLLKKTDSYFYKVMERHGVRLSQAEYVSAVMMALGAKHGYTITNPPQLTRELAEILNKGDIFQEIEDITMDDSFLKFLVISSANGEITDFRQNELGDCWLLAGIISLNSNPAGKELFKKQIVWNNDYSSVTVEFAGIGRKITVTMDEILSVIKDSNHSEGDVDVLIIELAMKKLLGETGRSIEGQSSDLFWEYFAPISSSSYEGAGIFKQKGPGPDHIMGYLAAAYEDLVLKGKNFAITFALSASTNNGEWHCPTVDGGSFDFKFNNKGEGHAFAITKITSNTVTFVNPWDSSIEYTVSWETFANMGISKLDRAVW